MKKPLVIMIVLLLVIAIAGGGTAFFFIHKGKAVDPNNIDLILKRSIATEDITTSLKDGTFIQISFNIEANSTDAKDELEKRLYQVKNIVIDYFSNKSTEELNRTNNITLLEKDIKKQINDIMSHGQIEKVYITKYVLQ